MNRREAIKWIAGSAVLSGMTVSSLASAETTETQLSSSPTPTPPPPEDSALEREGLQFWLESSLKRVYPTSEPGSARPITLLAARNEKVSFQACFRNNNRNSAKVSCQAKVTTADLKPLVRRVGFVPMRHLDTYVPAEEIEGKGFIPGLCPDPLFPEKIVHIGPHSNGVFWVSLSIPEDCPVGVHEVRVQLKLEGQFAYTDWVKMTPWTVDLTVKVDVRPLVVLRRKNFPVTHWISADSIWEYYKIEPCGDRFWELADAYIANLLAHNLDVVYTPIFNNRHEILVRPAQLLRVKRTAPDQYEFDFTDVQKWVRIALKHGANYIEWPHFFTPAPTSGKHPQRIFERGDKIGPLLWDKELLATSDTYRNFLVQFLAKFKEFLEAEGIMEKSLFHCADEPDGAVQIADYAKARAILKELAPWMKVIDAMSDVQFATNRLSDMPVPSIVTAPEFTKAGCPAWAYFCCGPRDAYVQRLLDTPLTKIRMLGWLLYRLEARGFLHWGHNYWFQFCTPNILDPYQDSSTGMWPGMPYGDAFVVYPGEKGPIDSIRWEILAEGLQDYALLQTAGIAPGVAMLKSIHDYKDFPKSEEWLRDARRQILEASGTSKS